MPPPRDVHTVFAPARSEQISAGCERVFVKGSYEYHHYGQNGNDFGWGCAYRSCQTLMSWLNLKGVPSVAADVPTVKELQSKLVMLGDKPPSFAQGTDWIGSVENSLLLDAYYNVQSRIINMENRPRQGLTPSVALQLVAHLEEVGSPIMVGGAGGGARTILGIEFQRTRGGVEGEARVTCVMVTRVLVLDPHYGGGDSGPEMAQHMPRICTWVEPAVLCAQYGAFTNFCLPIPPFPSAGAGGQTVSDSPGPHAESAEDWTGMFEVVGSG